MDLAEGRIVTIPAVEWEKFMAWVHAPSNDVQALRDLAAHKPAWKLTLSQTPHADDV